MDFFSIQCYDPWIGLYVCATATGFHNIAFKQSVQVIVLGLLSFLSQINEVGLTFRLPPIPNRNTELALHCFFQAMNKQYLQSNSVQDIINKTVEILKAM